MDREWFVLDRLNQVKGPYTVAEIRMLARTLAILVSRGDSGEWVPATSITEDSEAQPEGRIYTLHRPGRSRTGVQLDPDGQPAIGAINSRQNFQKAMDELLGLCKGLMADNRLTDEEIRYLEGWLVNHSEVATEWPANVIARRVSDVLADGRITEAERADLEQVLSKAVGAPPSPENAANRSTRLPIEVPEPGVLFPQRSFCLTGKFVYGPRSKCEAAVARRGGTCHGQPSATTNYVVIGTLASRDWVHGSFGRKIEAAVRLREAGHGLHIVSEEHWTTFLGPAPDG